jgi:hypothetical protein
MRILPPGDHELHRLFRSNFFGVKLHALDRQKVNACLARRQTFSPALEQYFERLMGRGSERGAGVYAFTRLIFHRIVDEHVRTP